jgi:hypothetical protein
MAIAGVLLNSHPTTTNAEEVYEVPVGKLLIILNGNISNSTAGIVSCQYVISASGGAHAVSENILWNYQIPAKDAQPLKGKWFVPAGGKIHFKSASANALTLKLTGVLVNV